MLLIAAVLLLTAYTARAAYLKTTILNMEPDKVYDITDSDFSTQYTIRDSGDYWIKGESTHAFVRITGGSNVTLHLMDRLYINTSMYSYVGSAVPAIWIEDFDGTVRLSVAGGAHAMMSGYWGSPGIQKNGLKTKLIFMTDDINNPGAVDAISSSMQLSAPGIGSSGGSGHPFGNVIFESGKWYATGSCSAAIGASRGNSVDGITINGGYVEAKHWVSMRNTPCGPGIGVTGYGGRFDNFTVNGGYVKSTGEDDTDGGKLCAPGIGAGYRAQVGTITINGGTVKAYAGARGPAGAKEGAAGIGATNFDAYGSATVDAIIINGGNVEAYAGGTPDLITAGLGGSSAKRVVIRGGRVKAEGFRNQPGIEASYVSIESGNVEATGGVSHHGVHRYGCGIWGHRELNISGGTVTARRKDTEGTNKDLAGTEIRITGGSVDATDNSKTPSNEKGQELRKTVFNLKDFDGGIVKNKAVESAAIEGLSYEYGVKDVQVNGNGKLYFWLPDRTAVKSAASEGIHYGGNVNAGDITDDNTHNVFLSRGKKVSLRYSDTSDPEGSAWIVMNETSLSEFHTDIRIPEGYQLNGFYLDNGKKIKLADPDGNYLSNVNDGGERITDDQRRWINEAKCRSTEELYYKKTPIEYSISFDSNIPAGASTGQQAGGDMTPMTGVKYDEEKDLPVCGFTLPGYECDGWAVQKDGEKKYEPNGKVVNLTDEDEATVTLYAHWKPKEYTITFKCGDGATGEDHTQHAVFDEPATLDRFSDEWGWDHNGNTLHGFATEAFGSFYDDGEDFVNLCTLNNSGDPEGKTLTAQWIGNGIICITVTKDGEPVEGLEGNIKLERVDGDTVTQTAVNPDPAKEWIYETASGIPGGTYRLSFDGDTPYIVPEEEREFHFENSEAKSIVLDYYTVSIKKDSGIDSAYFSESGGVTKPEELEYVADNKSVMIHAYALDGSHFTGYTSIGVEPQWDRSISEQEITVKGKTEITARSKGNLCHISFDPNTDGKVSGTMKDQDFVFGQNRNLYGNCFTRPGAGFLNWNTAPDGSGTVFSDRQEMDDSVWQSLGYPEDNTAITLYAVWDPDTYRISYDLDEGFLSGGENPETYTVDTPDITLFNPEWDDDAYEFEGWIGTGQSEPVKELIIKKGSTGDRHYSAIRKEIEFQVMFDTDGGSEVDTQSVRKHGKAVRPEDPVRDGADFAGWYSDQEYTTEYDFEREVLSDMVLYAKWTGDPVEPPESLPIDIRVSAPLKTVSYNGRSHVWRNEKLSERKKRKKCPDLDIVVEGVPETMSWNFVYKKTKNASEGKACYYIKLKKNRNSAAYRALSREGKRELRKDIRRKNAILRRKENRVYFSIKPINLNDFSPDRDKSSAAQTVYIRNDGSGDSLTLKRRKSGRTVWYADISGHRFRMRKKDIKNNTTGNLSQSVFLAAMPPG